MLYSGVLKLLPSFISEATILSNAIYYLCHFMSDLVERNTDRDF